jgi:two-component system cell cycle response regulator DivK
MGSLPHEPLIWVSGLLAAAAIGGILGYILRGWREERWAWERGSRSPSPEPTTRRVEAPVARNRSSWDRSAGGGLSPVGSGLEEGDGPAVLLVDDRLELLALHGSYLHEHGYRVLTAQDGETGLDYARTQKPAVIVLDQSMPRRTGIEVARELKADPATAHIPILLMTAHSYGAVGAAAKEVGCDGFLSKPVAPSRMLREVAIHLGRSSGQP